MTDATTRQAADPSYLIVGAGVFGVSTALHLAARQEKDGKAVAVTLVDRDAPDAPTRVAASWDWNKVVRADYEDPTYCALALEARDAWRGGNGGNNNNNNNSSSSNNGDTVEEEEGQEALFAPFYRESGVYWISRTGLADAVVDNYRRLGRGREVDEGLIAAVPVDEARGLYGGVFAEADYSGVARVLVNRTSGWADAAGALRRGIGRAVELGVRFVEAQVAALEFGGADGTTRGVIGVKTEDGRLLRADRTVLCTGSYTPKLLDESARRSGIDALRAGGRIIAAGVTTGLTVLDDEAMDRFGGMPVGIQENPPERGASNGSLPPDKDRQLKWWGQHIFKNTQKMPSGTELSAPPPARDYAQWDVPGSLKEDVSFANKATFGRQGESWKIEQHRICWEALTPSADFIVSPHPAAGGLYVATCGSFHGWKFLPVIGKYVAQMLEGSLAPELREKWAWDRELPDPSKNKSQGDLTILVLITDITGMCGQPWPMPLLGDVAIFIRKGASGARSGAEPRQAQQGPLRGAERAGAKASDPEAYLGIGRAIWVIDKPPGGTRDVWPPNFLLQPCEHQLDHQAHLRLHGHHPRVGAGPLRPSQDARRRGGGRAVPRRQSKTLMWTSVDDPAAYTIEAVLGPGAADGGFYRVQSFRASPLEMVEAYERARSVRLERQSLGMLSEIEDMLARVRASTPPSGYHEYIRLAYTKYIMNGTWDDETPDCSIKMAKQLSYWKFKKTPLIELNEPGKPEVNKDDLDETKKALNVLRFAKEVQVRDWLEDHQELKALINPLKHRDQTGSLVAATIKLERTQQRHAVAAHMALESINNRTCKNCKNPRNEGPFRICRSFGPDVFKGACQCCQYSSQAHNCEFHVSKKGSAFAQLDEDESDGDDAWPVITQEMLKKATTRQLEQTVIWCKAELANREGLAISPPSAKKRRRN
ncbi:hypothetical protein DL766_007542 [Monosporascus sp. MC13-8B]|uniref:FAD dependent oxidoreductase domain-containing protein n=1 Tax=Monosporascus cannonballus TaxID=155416 RepID=A0ABY0H5Q0_9PEZI|nr:hypothetical protein DL762_005128 [Monosporascus cannonballus]RYP23223.1 hypothetical protein DL766_007542 [Monosporascus sp. MC13-8B]